MQHRAARRARSKPRQFRQHRNQMLNITDVIVGHGVGSCSGSVHIAQEGQGGARGIAQILTRDFDRVLDWDFDRDFDKGFASPHHCFACAGPRCGMLWGLFFYVLRIFRVTYIFRPNGPGNIVGVARPEWEAEKFGIGSQ